MHRSTWAKEAGSGGRLTRALGLLLLGVFAFWLRYHHISTMEIFAPIRADAAEYVASAVNLHEHGIYSSDSSIPDGPPAPDSYRSPGYPLLLALIRATVGAERWYAAILVVQAVLGALLVPLTYLLARRFAFGWSAWLALSLIHI